jgi:hypothetical protein
VTIVPAPTEPGEQAFLVERYLPSVDLATLSQSINRVAKACTTGHDVRHLHSTFVPEDDTCFCVFRASSIEAVQAVNEVARFPVDRISAAISVLLEVHSPVIKELS